jgi:hypothetical protein
MTRQVSKTNPTLEYTLSVVQQAVMSNLNCNNIGRIVKFYPEMFTADVELMQQKQFYNTNYATPYLVDVPIIVIGGTNSGITMPDYEGCYCHLAFMDRNIDAWYETGEAYAPDDARMHDFSDAVALVGLHSLQNPVANYEQGVLNIWNGTDTSNCKLQIKENSFNVNVVSTPPEESEDEATAVNSIFTIDDKFKIANASQDLLTLITNLLTACENIAVTPNTGVITPQSKQAFTDLKTTFAELLK